MFTRILAAALLGALMFLTCGYADEPRARQEDKKPGYAELSKLIQEAIAEKAPKRYEDKSSWGMTIRLPDKVRFPGLKRTVIRKGKKLTAPDGVWKRYLVWLEDPASDIKVQVRELQATGPQTYRVKMDIEVAVRGEGERQRWRNGVRLLAVSAQADAVVTAALTIEVKLSFDKKTFPPEVVVEPKVTESKLLLQRFDLNRVGNVLIGGEARQVGDQLKDVLQDLLTQYDEDVKEAANDAIADALKAGKGRLSAAALLKLAASADGKN